MSTWEFVLRAQIDDVALTQLGPAFYQVSSNPNAWPDLGALVRASRGLIGDSEIVAVQRVPEAEEMEEDYTIDEHGAQVW